MYVSLGSGRCQNQDRLLSYSLSPFYVKIGLSLKFVWSYVWYKQLILILHSFLVCVACDCFWSFHSFNIVSIVFLKYYFIICFMFLSLSVICLSCWTNYVMFKHLIVFEHIQIKLSCISIQRMLKIMYK